MNPLSENAGVTAPAGASGDPLVSVILPVYNGECFVGQTIESALRQTYRNLELIVIDDGSTDHTHKIVKRMAEQDQRIRLIRQPNAGIAGARNRGLREARGEFVAPLDADDLWDPAKIERQVRRMRECGEETGLVYCWWVWIDEEGTVLDRSPSWQIEGKTHDLLLQINFTGNASVPLYRRRCLQEVGGYNQDFERRGARGCEDWDLALKVAACFRVAVVPELLVGYRRLPNSMSAHCEVMWRSQQLLADGVVQRQPDLDPDLLRRSSDQFALYVAGIFFRSEHYVKSCAWAIRAWRTGLFFRVLPYVVRVFARKLWFAGNSRTLVMTPGTSLDGADIAEPLIPYDSVYRAQAKAGEYRRGASYWLRASWLQTLIIVLSVMFSGWLERDNDGLWFQGDSPRHAVNGFFWYDAIAAQPAALTDFAVRYYARYPLINPVMYPPLFYVMEGFAFRLFGPTPQIAGRLVLFLGIVAALYTMAWARQWIGESAGWAGAFLAFVPGMFMWSNAVMLNVPSTAFGMAGLYHWRKWFDFGERKQLVASVCFGAAALMTYFQAVIAVIICLAWALLIQAKRETGFRRWHVAVVLGIMVILPVLLAAALIPVFVERHLPGASTLLKVNIWAFYPRSLPGLLGPVLTVLGFAGITVGILRGRRREAWFITIWIGTPIIVFSFFPAQDSRYILIIAPAFVLAAALGCVSVRFFAWISPGSLLFIIAAGLTFSAWQAARMQLPQRSGFRAVASYLRQQAADAVLYDGYHDGLFGFYFRVLDPQFQQRLVLGQQILYHFGPASTFNWEETLNAKTLEEVQQVLRTCSGCHWAAIEIGRRSEWAQGQRLLRQAVTGPGFELVHSFPVIAPDAVRIDLYRIVGPVKPVSTVDVRVTSFSNRTYRNVSPITR